MPLLSSFVNDELLCNLKSLNPPIITVEELLSADDFKLTNELGQKNISISELKRRIAQKILNLDTSQSIVSWKNLNSAIPINIDNRNKLCPSGWKTLDEVFLGGFPSGNVIQILGKASTGKTQLCLSTAVSSARLSMKVLLIDTCNTVSLKRIQKLLQSAIINENNLALLRNEKLEISKIYNDSLSNLHIQRCFDLFSTFDLLTKVKELKKFDIIIIDSLHQLFSQFIDYIDNVKYYNMHSSSVSSNYVNKNLLVNSNPVISNFYVLLRSISATGTTVLVTNVLETKKLASSQYSTIQNNSEFNTNSNLGGNLINNNFESGTGSIHNSVEIFDITIVMSVENEFSSKTGKTFYADIVQRPPYYNSFPSKLQIEIPIII